jgi:hypothetical protein
VPLTSENVPEVGLELHSRPCKHWELQKSSPIRGRPADVYGSPTARNVDTVTTSFCATSYLIKGDCRVSIAEGRGRHLDDAGPFGLRGQPL